MIFTRAITKDEIEQACDLFNLYVDPGHNVDDYSDIRTKAVFIAKHSGKIVGAVTCGFLFDELDNFDSYWLSQNPGRLAWIESIAVEDRYQGRGYGKYLAEVAIAWCNKNISDRIVALCWESPKDRQSLILFKDLGFEEVEHFKHPWAGEYCVVCGNDCSCDATLVFKEKLDA